jgi:hypothetical protein
MLTVILSALLAAQAAPVPTADVSSEAVNRAQAWLLATYPALRRGDLAVRVYGDAQTMRLEVTAQPAAQAPGDRTQPAPILTVDLHASADGRVERMTAQGPLVQSAARDALQAQVAAHPEWTDMDVADAINAAGGRHGPGAPPARSPAALGAVLKAAVTVGRSTFVRRDARGPVWIVDVAAPTRTYQVAFEPLGGQVIAVTPK